MSKSKAGLVALAGAAVLAPAPEAHAMSCLTGPFFIFFDWKSDELTANARALLDNAAAAHGVCGLSEWRVLVAGHGDRSGSANRNLLLSRRRAEHVAAYLKQAGIPDSLIFTYGFGETRPLVETPDGVEEAQNRRVEITFQQPAW
jgi:outer membrane protein OmpA-like peptidoglycan-associated protein